MKVERLERVAISVKNLDEAEKSFSDLLGIKFERVPREKSKSWAAFTEHADPSFKGLFKITRTAVSPTGLELCETPSIEKEGVLCFHLKVSDIEEAKAELKRKGVRLQFEVIAGGLKEAVFHADDLHGARLVLVEYKGPSTMAAILQE